MYVEKERVINKNSSIKMSSSDVNVKEATAALKGMLGIGSNTPSKKSETVASPVSEEPSSKVEAGQSSKKKKKNQRPKKTKQSVPKTENKPSQQMTPTEGSEKFAWSAFQAPPDASSLPIPAFSPAITRPTVDVSGLTTSVPEERSDIADTTRTGDAVVEEKTVDEPLVQEEEEEEEEKALVSNTGINLAALAASPPSHTSTNPTPLHTMPSQDAAYEPPIHRHVPHYPQPPHFMTIQVQVPPVLMPGRQMVVASPMGYHVQVTVPEGVPPGMVIPVHVPAYGHPPPHMMPGPRPPPHMMPPGPAPPSHMMPPGPATAPHMRPGPYPPHGFHPRPS
jgi:hypothetical protein